MVFNCVYHYGKKQGATFEKIKTKQFENLRMWTLITDTLYKRG